MDSINEPPRIVDDLLRSMLEEWIVAEISDANLLREMSEVPLEPRRGRGFQSVRKSRASVSDRYRASR